jgi:hypothetical protein
LLKYFVTILTHSKTLAQNLDAAGVNASLRRYAHNVGTGIRVRLDVGAGVIFLVALAPIRAADGARY